jgi:hypothetical protein
LRRGGRGGSIGKDVRNDVDGRVFQDTLQHLGFDASCALDESDDIVGHGGIDLLGQLDVKFLEGFCIDGHPRISPYET